jgi:hypothetical protein
MQSRIQILARSAQEVGSVNPGAMTSWLSFRLLLPAMSTTAGAAGCHRLSRAWRPIRVAGFVAGCVAGAILECWFDIGALALPVMLAVLAVALGEQKGRTYEQF